MAKNITPESIKYADTELVRCMSSSDFVWFKNNIIQGRCKGFCLQGHVSGNSLNYELKRVNCYCKRVLKIIATSLNLKQIFS